MTQTMMDVPDDHIARTQTPITMENAVQFGFKVGLGILGVQLITGGLIGLAWLFIYNGSHHM
jgi:hypothetical protein